MIRRTPGFLASLMEQALYLELHASEDVADRFMLAVESAATFLETYPLVGRVGEFRHPDLQLVRRWRVKDFPNHILLYVPEGDGIKLVLVVHASRDFEALFEDVPVA